MLTATRSLLSTISIASSCLSRINAPAVPSLATSKGSVHGDRGRRQVLYSSSRIFFGRPKSACLPHLTPASSSLLVPMPPQFSPCVWSQRGTFFIRSRDTPNPDCLMFYSRGYKFLKSEAAADISHHVDSSGENGSCENQANRIIHASRDGSSSCTPIAMTFLKSDRHLSPLAEKIFAVNGIVEVTVGSTFVTVRRHNEALDGALDTEDAGEDDDIDDLEGNKHFTSVAETDFASFAAKQHEWKTRMNRASLPPTIANASSSAPSLNQTHHVGGRRGTEDLSETKIEKLPHGVTARTIEFNPSLLNPPQDWHELRLPVMAAITDHVTSGLPAISLDAPHPHLDTLPADGDSDVVLMIKEHLATNVRPVLHADGGDVRYAGYQPETGTLLLELLGACRRCGSAATTLNDLIERTTRHWIPEVKSVVDIGVAPADKTHATSVDRSTVSPTVDGTLDTQ